MKKLLYTYLVPFLLIGALWLVCTPDRAEAQEINFSDYGQFTITLQDISMGDLEFVGPIISGGGLYSVELIDSYVLSIIGVKYLDVGVQIQGDGVLTLDGNPEYANDPSRSIPFQLKAAYANMGENSVTDSRFIEVAGGNFGVSRFPILARQNLPPGPPPPPPTEGFDQSLVEEAAYLYLYGQIDVGDVVSGFYSGDIIITVEYE